jgi:CitMHS family citrate-Mg2+:H+ or citrate-Ca2+:H+ symporter
MLPLYERLHMDRRILACVASMAAGVNFLPWTGPTLRASAALHIPTTELFRPLIPVQIVGLAFVFVVAYVLGTKEERRLGLQVADAAPGGPRLLSPDVLAIRRPERSINDADHADADAVMIGGIVDRGDVHARHWASSSTTGLNNAATTRARRPRWLPF